MKRRGRVSLWGRGKESGSQDRQDTLMSLGRVTSRLDKASFASRGVGTPGGLLAGTRTKKAAWNASGLTMGDKPVSCSMGLCMVATTGRQISDCNQWDRGNNRARASISCWVV